MSGLNTKATKTGRTLVAETGNAAGAQTTGDALDLTEVLGLTVIGRVTNGSSGPSEGCAMVVEISHDGTTWRRWSRQQAGTEDDQAYTFVVDLPPSVLHARVVFEGNTGEAVTVEALGHELTGVSHA